MGWYHVLRWWVHILVNVIIVDATKIDLVSQAIISWRMIVTIVTQAMEGSIMIGS
jgi:hypothetical protein